MARVGLFGVGLVATGIVAVAAVESALLPGLAIGVVAGLAPRLWLPRRKGRRQGVTPVRRADALAHRARAIDYRQLKMTRAALKTVTFRIVVTALDFSVNYIVLGDLTLAAGLSGFSLVAGPLFYFLHETLWNARDARARFEQRPVEAVRIFRVTFSRALAKTIAYRALATASEFTATWIIVGDPLTAALLSSAGFVIGPFVYYAHERFWERLDETSRAPSAPVLRLTYAGA